MKKTEATGTKKPQVFTELGMKRKENRIPQLAENAVKKSTDTNIGLWPECY